MKTLVKLHILAIPYSFHVFSHIIDNHDLDYSQGNSKDISSIVKVRQTAFTQEEINGFSTPEPKSSRLNTIDKIDMTCDMQRKAIGRALVSSVEEIAKFAGIRLMNTDSMENTAGAPWKSCQFWVKMAYKDTGRE